VLTGGSVRAMTAFPSARGIAAAFLLVSGLALAADSGVQGLKLPKYDRTGRLVWVLNAERATDLLQDKDPILQNGRIEIFGPGSAVQPIGLLTFPDAIYRPSTNTISSDHELKLASAEGTVSGRGYGGRLAECVIEFRAAVVAEAKGYHLTSQAARVRYDPEAKGRDMLREIVATGRVEVTPLPGTKAPNDAVRLTTTEARYDADRGQILLRYPVTMWTQAGDSYPMENTGRQEFFPIELKE
jgi:hypothetical protein